MSDRQLERSVGHADWQQAHTVLGQRDGDDPRAGADRLDIWCE
jgi:hypothetical protein